MKKIFLLAAVLLMAAGCGPKTEAPDNGEVRDGVYRNGFFGFSMEVPDGMHVAERNGLDSISQNMGSVMGMNPEQGGDEQMSGVLFLISANELGGADSVFNYNITAVWERLPKALRIGSSEKYLSMAIKMLESAGGETGGVAAERTDLGGREFLKITLPGSAEAGQDVYVYLKDGYALVIVGSYSGEEQKVAVDKVVSTVKFNQP